MGADRIAFVRGLKYFERIAELARDQVTLVCALELASHYKNGDVADPLYRYTKHPGADVAVNAMKRLTTTQAPLPADFSR